MRTNILGNKKILFVILLVIIALVAFYRIITYNNSIQSQSYEISDLSNKVQNLEIKISELEEVKSQLISTNQDLSKTISELSQENMDFKNKINNIKDGSYVETSNIPPSNINSQSVERGNNSSQITSIVVYSQRGCTYYVLESSNGYTIAEWREGRILDMGDKVEGNVNSNGTRDFFELYRRSKTKLWIEDFMLSKEVALDKVYKKCN